METTLTPEQVRDRLNKAHVTLNQFCKRFHLTRSTFWRWEKGQSNPRPLLIQKLSDGLKIVERERKQYD